MTRRPWILSVAALAAAACGGDTTGPSTAPEFDARATAQTLAEFTNMPAGTDAVFAQLGLAAGTLSPEGGAAAGAGLPASVAGLSELDRSGVPGLPGLAALLASRGASVPLFPADLLGKTFVWDPVSRSYVLDEGLGGAPANGVRFILYSVNPLTGEPSTPLQPIGFLDLVDESDATATRLRLTAVDTSGGDPVTLVDYLLAGTFEVTGTLTVRLTADGFLSDGRDELDFSLAQEITAGEEPGSFGVALEHRLGVAGRDASVELVLAATGVEGEEDPRSLDATLTIRDGTERSVLEVRVAEASLSGSVRHNGRIVIVIGGPADAPTFTRPGGEPLLAEELSALKDIFDAIEGILNFGNEILRPIAELFGVDG